MKKEKDELQEYYERKIYELTEKINEKARNSIKYNFKVFNLIF